MTALTLDSACCHQLNWRTDLPVGLDPAGLEGLLAEEGWKARSRHPALKVLRHAAGHEVAWVVTTGRVQIRVDLGVPRGERRGRARAVHRTLEACVDRLGAAG